MGAAAGGKAGVGRPLWPAGTVWEGRPLLLARPGGQGEWARDLGPRHGVCTDRRAAGQKRCCHEPPVRARAGPASSLGPRCCHPLTQRTRCSSCWSGLCAARRHKAGRRTSDVGAREGQHCAGATQGPSTGRAPTGPRHTRRQRPPPPGAAAPLGPRQRPPQPRAGPPPARISGGTTHLVARGGRGQGWAQRGCAFRRGRGSAASSAGRTIGEQGRAGEGERGEGRRAPLLLTSSRAGSSPRGGAWQGTALLCVAGPVCSAPRRRPPSRQRGRPFY